ncbi:MAG TPA: phosphoribosylformylglycinamidine cyclo-ligase [Gammaproteobacteria bacterium]|nr:phosphoribosylformylglycinamidine cyclo-ligase [Gammaproteobacteria bacterium]
MQAKYLQKAVLLLTLSLNNLAFANTMTYAGAGVDIHTADRLVDKIRPMCAATNRPGCLKAEIGNYGSLFSLNEAGANIKDPILVSGTDGVGTKLLLAQKIGKHNTIGIDLVAMSVNDVLTRGAQPLYFLDYFASGKLEVNDAAAVVEGIANGCKQAGCGLIGGETAEMPGMYGPGVYDLAGFAVGVVSKSDILPRKVNDGDVLIGLASTGLHSNGFSLVRKVLEKSKLSLDSKPPFNSEQATMGDVLLTPTRIYVSTVKPMLDQRLIEAMAHITGSGMPGNLPRVYGEDLVASIDVKTWEVPAVFKWVAQAGPVASNEMFNTFNCGIGMILIVKKQNVDKVLKQLATTDVKAYKIGVMRKRDGAEAQVEFNGDLFA